MTEPTATTPKQKRRTPAELKAHYLLKAKEAEEAEKAAAARLLTVAHDAVASAAAYESSKPHAPTMNSVLQGLKAIIAALAPKKP